MTPAGLPPLHIAIGTLNEAKRLAVSRTVSELFPAVQVHIHPYAVSSGVRDQPLSDEETMQGAMNRAKEALAKCDAATYGVGIEGGAHQVGDRWFESGWIAVLDRQGKIGLGTSGRFELSPKIMSRLLGGEELAQVIDDLSGLEDVRSNAGAMGILTLGHVNRDVAYAHGIFFAFAPFVSHARYWT